MKQFAQADDKKIASRQPPLRMLRRQDIKVLKSVAWTQKEENTKSVCTLDVEISMDERGHETCEWWVVL